MGHAIVLLTGLTRSGSQARALDTTRRDRRVQTTCRLWGRHLAVVSMRSSWYETVKENLAARLLTRCSRFQTLPIVYFIPFLLPGLGQNLPLPLTSPLYFASTRGCGNLFCKTIFFSITSFLDYFTLPFFTISKALPFRRIQSSIHALVLIRIFSSWNDVFSSLPRNKQIICTIRCLFLKPPEGRQITSIIIFTTLLLLLLLHFGLLSVRGNPPGPGQERRTGIPAPRKVKFSKLECFAFV